MTLDQASMQIELKVSHSFTERESIALLIDANSNLASIIKKAEERVYIEEKIKDQSIVQVNQLYRSVFIIKLPECDNSFQKKEKLRRLGADLYLRVKKEGNHKLELGALIKDDQLLLTLAEGYLLAGYKFLKYKTKEKVNVAGHLTIVSEKIDLTAITTLKNIILGTCKARDLVNEPVNYLTAEQLSTELIKLGKEAGFKVTVFDKEKITKLKMGGLLSVNLGSPNPPTFNILEYKPREAKNQNPIVLIGKGVVYDTGGLSLKPTPNSMDKMKSDMAGAAAVAGAIYALAANNVPVYVVVLIPATENRPSGNAMVPGDVITMHDGTTVEVLNTDAEGRLILADALSFAAQYSPELAIDLATLTGAAARAIGKEGIVMMGTAKPETKSSLLESGYEVHERLVEFPLWEEYKKHIESDIADLKNIGGEEAGAITAGKFLEHFVSFPWIHLDIAGSAFLDSTDAYRTKNGSGVGVRLLYNFITKTISSQ